MASVKEIVEMKKKFLISEISVSEFREFLNKNAKQMDKHLNHDMPFLTHIKSKENIAKEILSYPEDDAFNNASLYCRIDYSMGWYMPKTLGYYTADYKIVKDFNKNRDYGKYKKLIQFAEGDISLEEIEKDKESLTLYKQALSSIEAEKRTDKFNKYSFINLAVQNLMVEKGYKVLFTNRYLCYQPMSWICNDYFDDNKSLQIMNSIPLSLKSLDEMYLWLKNRIEPEIKEKKYNWDYMWKDILG